MTLKVKKMTKNLQKDKVRYMYYTFAKDFPGKCALCDHGHGTAKEFSLYTSDAHNQSSTVAQSENNKKQVSI